MLDAMIEMEIDVVFIVENMQKHDYIMIISHED